MLSQAFPRSFSPFLPWAVSSLPSLRNTFAFCPHICPSPGPRNQLWHAGPGTLLQVPCRMLRSQTPLPALKSLQ